MGHLGIDRDGLRRFLGRVNARFPLDAAFVGGSRVRGDELVESDYDLVLVSPAFAALPWIRRIEATAAEWDLTAPADLFAFTGDELARKRTEIGSVAEIMKDAIPVWPEP
ncbi:MAG: nucleotidyltransferase domain-containing protein [Myxococcota bacterium]|nr:nucleotidyltransferase domain-containing protein [Myxococcota bacterium]